MAEPDPAALMDAPPIPVTVLTGCLGAGKTTLLNRILSAPGERRYAVIVNEFAELGIDGDLVLEAQEEIVTLTNGCVCCNVRGDLLRALKSIVARNVPYDSIVVETTGLADPAPVIQTFYMDPRLAGGIRLDGVVTLVDARHFRQQLSRSPETASQIVAADLILLNKTDLVSAGEADAAEVDVRALNSFASIRRTTHATVPISDIFGRNGFDLQHVLERLSGFGDDGPRHASGVESVSIEIERPVDLDRFLRWIDSVIALQSDDVMRVKGILNVSGDERLFVFQAVHRIMDGDFIQRGRAGLQRSRLVIIGRNLDRARLRRNFEGCQSSHDSSPVINDERVSSREHLSGDYWENPANTHFKETQNEFR